METPTKTTSRVLSQSNRRESRLFTYRKNLSFDDPPPPLSHTSTSSQHATTLFHTDSGYNSTSESLFSPYNSPVSNHAHRSHRSLHAVSCTPLLESIVEDQESPSPRTSCAHELTPTTRHQLDRLSAVHITTPASPPKKRGAPTPLQCVDDATTIKLRRLMPFSATPRKQPTAHAQRQQLFRDALDQSADAATENSENQPCATSFHSDRMEFSPIVGQRPVTFERKRSEHSLQSSTPIGGSTWRTNRLKGCTGQKAPTAIAASRVLRKTQSFSPSKYFQTKYNKDSGCVSNVVLGLPSPRALPRSPVSSCTALSVNPARKLLDFDVGSFETLVKGADAAKPVRHVLQRQRAVTPDMELDVGSVSPTCTNVSSAAAHATMSSPLSNRSIMSHPSMDILLNAAIVSETSRPCAAPREPVTPDMDLEPAFTSPKRATTTPFPSPSSNLSILSRMDILLNAAIIPDRSLSCAPPPLLRTPRKQLTHSASCTSPARREANQILYANLPCTPPRSASKQQRLLKRTASAHQLHRSPVKRKLYETKRRHQYLGGMSLVDMLGRLEGVLPATDLIFRQLSTVDLVACRQVSRRWRRIVESNGRALHRVERSARRQEVFKENTDVVAGAPILLPGIACVKSRVPFSSCNSLAASATSGVTQVVVVSPRTKAFQENQKIVKTITKSQRLMKCPRCSGSSIVDRTENEAQASSSATITPLSGQTKSTPLFRNAIGQLTMRTPNLGALAKHQSCPIPFQTPTAADWSSFDDSGVFGMSVDSHHSLVTPASRVTKWKHRTASQIEFGQCTNQQCGFRFCVSCWRDFDGEEHTCSITHDHQQQRHRPTEAVAGSKQSKRNLRRLLVP